MSFLKNIFGKQSEEPIGKTSEIQTAENLPQFPDLESEAPLVLTKTIKRQQIKHHLLTKGSIDSWTAIQMYKETRLSAVIFDLRMRGYDIDSVPNSAIDTNGNLTKFTTYHLLNKQK